MIFPDSRILESGFFLLFAPFAIIEILPFSFVNKRQIRLESLKGIVLNTIAFESINNINKLLKIQHYIGLVDLYKYTLNCLYYHQMVCTVL